MRIVCVLAIIGWLSGASSAASGGQILGLAPADVVFTSDFYSSFPVYAGGNVLNAQTGPVSDGVPGSGNYWVTDTSNTEYLVIDLQQPYDLASFDVFNTHNGGAGGGDRGAGSVTITGSNTLANLEAPTAVGTVLVASGAMTYSLADPITAQSFSSGDTSDAFRYIRIDATVAAEKVSTGLNEVRLFGTVAAPEPSTLLLLGLGAAGLLAIARKRK